MPRNPTFFRQNCENPTKVGNSDSLQTLLSVGVMDRTVRHAVSDSYCGGIKSIYLQAVEPLVLGDLHSCQFA